MRDDQDFIYRYFLIGDANPVRVKYDGRARPFFAENPDRAASGKLKSAVTRLSVISKDVEEISQEKFEAQCQVLWKEGPWRPRGDANMRRE
jgi:hypothetical protein